MMTDSTKERDVPRRSFLRSGLGASVLCSALAAPFIMVACGGEEAKPPATAANAASSAPSSSAHAPAVVPTAHADVTGAAKASYDRGYAAFMAGDLAAAKQAFTDASHADPHAPAPLYSLGTVLEHQGDTGGAQQQYKAALAVKPDDTTAIGAYAMCLASSAHLSEADSFLTTQQQKHQNSAPITTYLAEVKSMEGDTGSAQQLAQDALRMSPDYKPAMVAIAHDHYRTHRTELAKYALQAVLDGFGESSPPRDKDNADAHLIRGLIEEDSRQRAAAMADYDAARKTRPDLVEALIHLGVMKLQAGNVQEATPLLESAVKFAPNAPLAHLNLADAYRLGGRVADAKREFEKALSMDSSLAVAHYDMGLLYLFSPNVPGTTATDQIATAIRELETYRSMRGGKAGGEDVDELLARAQAKQADLKVSAAPAAAPAAAAPAGVAPAASSAPAKSAPATAASASPKK
jgi:Tfp pilus assembly protein PilF